MQHAPLCTSLQLRPSADIVASSLISLLCKQVGSPPSDLSWTPLGHQAQHAGSPFQDGKQTGASQVSPAVPRRALLCAPAYKAPPIASLALLHHQSLHVAFVKTNVQSMLLATSAVCSCRLAIHPAHTYKQVFLHQWRASVWHFCCPTALHCPFLKWLRRPSTCLLHLHMPLPAFHPPPPPSKSSSAVRLLE